MAAPGEKKYIIRIAFSIIGILVGLSIFIVFGFNYKNWNVAVWGIMSGLGAAITLYVHVGNKRRKWDSYPEALKFYMLLGCFIQLAGVCGFVTYLALGISNHQDLIVYGEGYFLTTVWCFMTWKWGFILFLYSRFYKRQYYNVYTILPKSDEDAVNSYGGSSHVYQ